MPYFDAAYSGQAAVWEEATWEGRGSGSDLAVSGAGAMLGGGLDYFMSPAVSIGVGLSATFGTFNQIEYEGQTQEIDMTAARFEVGLLLYPFR